MRKLSLIICLLLIICSCADNNMKYKVTDSKGDNYYTNSYSKNDNCITFQYECNCSASDTKTVTLCGSYKIEEK